MIYPIQSPPNPTDSPNQRMKAITGRDYVTYSEVATFQKCPLQWKFRYVDGARPEEISAALVLGSGVHAAVEHHFQAILQAGVLPVLPELIQVFDACWDSETKELPVAFAKGQDRDISRATAQRMIQCFMDSSHAVPDGRLVGIEESFRVVLADDLPDLMGRVDVVTWRDNELLITDYKTSRCMWAPETAQENADQLMLYSVGMQDLARTLSAEARIALRFVILTKTKEPKIESLPVQLDADRLHRTRLTVRNVVSAMQQANRHNTIYPSPSQMNCACCPFKQRCAGWHQSG